jgi:DNA-binding GntR family transcriptional regulator
VGKTRETNLSNVIYKKLRRAIATGELSPGEKIIESKMIREFGASRTPFREAVKRLEATGFLDTIHNNGTYVRKVTLQEVEQIFEVLSMLEGYASYLATQNITSQEVDELVQLNTDMRGLTQAGNHAAFHDKNVEFHVLLSRLSRNEFLQNLIRDGYDRIHRYRFIGTTVGDNFQEFLSSHEALIEAIKERNAKKAEEEMREHIKKIKDIVISFLRAFKI